MNNETTRTAQDLLAERRYNIQEARRETDAMAKAMLMAHVALLDATLAAMRTDPMPEGE